MYKKLIAVAVIFFMMLTPLIGCGQPQAPPEPTPEEEPTPKEEKSFWDRIPGFPFESIIIGLIFSVILLWLIQRARRM